MCHHQQLHQHQRPQSVCHHHRYFFLFWRSFLKKLCTAFFKGDFFEGKLYVAFSKKLIHIFTGEERCHRATGLKDVESFIWKLGTAKRRTSFSSKTSRVLRASTSRSISPQNLDFTQVRGCNLKSYERKDSGTTGPAYYDSCAAMELSLKTE